MSDNENFGFGKFVPGFDFLQNLAKGASQALPQMPHLSNWIAPTLNPEELERRIGELKAVHFWLDQNSKALGATIQALEVQKMTLATLKGMNFSMGEVADALKLKIPESVPSGAREVAVTAAAAPEPVSAATSTETGKAKPARKSSAKPQQPGSGVVDPLQWWGALTQQFQQIAATAMKDVATQSAVDSARNMASGMAKEALKSASGMAKTASGSTGGTARKTSARRPAKKKE
jgi:hypothetical protein